MVARGRTDASNACRIKVRYGEVTRWVGPWDKWLIWDGSRWKLDQALAIDLKAKDIAADLFNEIGAALKGNDEIDQQTVRAVYAFAKHSNSAGGIRNMVTLAKSDLAIAFEKLDADPWLFNVQNGTLDLRTGQLREHRKEDFITKLAPVTFDPAARCPLWRGFLETVLQVNEALISYVRRLAGYCLTGVTEEHILPFLHGTGANGKTTLVETLLKLMGPDYGMKAAPDLLMARRGESHPTDRADLFGKRFVACVETEEGRRMAEALTKELTGGDRVRARRMREDFWEFSPTHHVWLAGNHKPTITGSDHGIWRRVKLIPFDVVIPNAKQDKKLSAKLAGELPGILNWALLGCLDWQKGGMQEPPAVQAATGQYSIEMDEVGQFIDEQCQTGPDFLASATELFKAFQEAFPDSRISQHAFGARLRQKGFLNRDPVSGKECRTNKGKHAWKGLRLLSNAERRAGKG
jgi:putative DNA primase/helicase